MERIEKNRREGLNYIKGICESREELSYIEKIHKSNFELINSLNVNVGDRFILTEEFNCFGIGSIFNIKVIHPYYYWVLFEETESLPQVMTELLKIGYFENKLEEKK